MKNALLELIADLSCGICHALRPETLGDLEAAAERIKVLELLLEKTQALVPPVFEPVTDLKTISRSDFLKEFARYGIVPVSGDDPLDSTLTLAGKVELDRIASYLVYPAEYYVAEIFDCEDYAIQAQCDAGHKFHVSGIRLGLGYMPLGYHGFALTLDKDELRPYWLDNNAGFPWAGKWYTVDAIIEDEIYGKVSYLPRKVFA